MKCTNKKQQRLEQQAAAYGYTTREYQRYTQEEHTQKVHARIIAASLLGLAALTILMAYLVYFFVLRSHDYRLALPYDGKNQVLGLASYDLGGEKSKAFAADLAVTDTDVQADKLSLTARGAGLFDLSKSEVLFAKDVFTERSPASLTKIMTALVAMKYGNLDDKVVVTDTAKNIEYGSSVCDIKTGEVYSLRQLIYGLLIASGNDAAMMIAEHVGGDVDSFVSLMNQEAQAIGATHTNFMNPHGLTQEGHYTCVYDLYLMMNEALKNDVFQDIIGRKNYYAEYTTATGEAGAVTWESTDHYLTGEASGPSNVIVYGGKTGTTDDAGACLALLSKDLYGNPFVSIIMHADDKELLYDEMNSVLSLVPTS